MKFGLFKSSEDNLTKALIECNLALQAPDKSKLELLENSLKAYEKTNKDPYAFEIKERLAKGFHQLAEANKKVGRHTASRRCSTEEEKFHQEITLMKEYGNLRPLMRA
ncbi:MAG TPA: hypothetical protein DIC51_05330 [Coxiellaceae bacterium]|nr:hypothetical protein [Coxiellaceae bacterium]